jgi:outer membrane protein
MNKFLKTTLAMALGAMALGASAQKAGDNIYSLGYASINPDAKLGTVTSTSASALTAATFTNSLKNATASVGSQSTVSFGWLHMYTDNVGAELTLGIPARFTQDLYTPNGSAQSHPAAATLKILTPTAVAKYFFGTAQDQWRPYVGLGLSRVTFNSVSTNNSDTTVAALASTSASFSSSWVPVYNAGMVYNIDDKWSVNGSVSYLPVRTTATFMGPGSPLLGSVPVTSSGDVKLGTTDFVIRLGYRY